MMICRLLGCTGLLLCLSLAGGCAKYATLQQHRPARVQTDLRRLAIVAAPPSREEGLQVIESLRAELDRAARFELLGEDAVQQASVAPLVLASGAIDQAASLAACRRMGVDGLLTARVQFLETDGAVYGTKAVRIGDPEVVAVVRYTLIDVRSGQLLDQNAVQSAPFKGELRPHTPGPSTETTILTELAAEAGAQLARVLLPYEEAIEVRLAHAAMGPGSTDVRRGMKAAQAGDWAEARTHWSQALEADPASDAAAYNLALAHEALGDFAEARLALQTATAENPKALYRTTLERVERAEAELRLAQLASHQATARRDAAVPRHLPPVRPASHSETFWR